MSRESYGLASDLTARLKSDWWFKFLGITAFVVVFFAAYFALLRFPAFPVTLIPLTAIDRWIVFAPWSIGFYYSLWLYVSLPPALLNTRREIQLYGWLAGCVAIVGLSIFFFWPTSIPATTGIDWSSHPGFALLKNVDAAQNACPSLHVAFAVFSGVWLDRILRTMPVRAWARIVNAVWCIGIVYSTIATRQHVAIDVAAGALLGLAIASIKPAALRWKPARRSHAVEPR